MFHRVAENTKDSGQWCEGRKGGGSGHTHTHSYSRLQHQTANGPVSRHTGTGVDRDSRRNVCLAGKQQYGQISKMSFVSKL